VLGEVARVAERLEPALNGGRRWRVMNGAEELVDGGAAEAPDGIEDLAVELVWRANGHPRAPLFGLLPAFEITGDVGHAVAHGGCEDLEVAGEIARRLRVSESGGGGAKGHAAELAVAQHEEASRVEASLQLVVHDSHPRDPSRPSLVELSKTKEQGRRAQDRVIGDQLVAVDPLVEPHDVRRRLGLLPPVVDQTA